MTSQYKIKVLEDFSFRKKQYYAGGSVKRDDFSATELKVLQQMGKLEKPKQEKVESQPKEAKKVAKKDASKS